jgi:hypothetical protein
VSNVVRINATIDRSLLDRVDQYAARNAEDRSTAIRQLLRLALRQLSTDDAVAAYRHGRLTLRQFAEALDLDVWGAHDLLASERVAIAQGSRQETQADLDALLATARSGRRQRKRGPGSSTSPA